MGSYKKSWNNVTIKLSLELGQKLRERVEQENRKNMRYVSVTNIVTDALIAYLFKEEEDERCNGEG